MKIYVYVMILLSFFNNNTLMTMASAQVLQTKTWRYSNHIFMFKCVDSIDDEDIIKVPGHLVHYSKTLRTMIDNLGDPKVTIPLFKLTKNDLKQIITCLEIVVDPQKTDNNLIAYYASLNQKQLLEFILHLDFLDIQVLLMPAIEVLQKLLVQSSTDILTWKLGLPQAILNLLKHTALQNMNTSVIQCRPGQQTINEAFSSIAVNQNGSLYAMSQLDAHVINIGVPGERTIPLQGHIGLIGSLQFSSNSQYIASASPEDKTVRVWNIGTQQEIVQFKNHRQGLLDMQFSSDSNYFACLGWDVIPENDADESYAIIDRKTGRIQTLKDVKGYVYDMAVSDDGKHVALVGDNVYIWNVQKQQLQQLEMADVPLPIMRVAFSPNGALLVCSTAPTEAGTIELILWDIETQKLHAPKIITQNTPETIIFSKDSTLLAYDDEGDVLIWDVRKDSPLGRIETTSKHVHSIDFTSDNKYVIATVHDSVIRVLNLEKNKEENLIGSTSIIDGAYSISNTAVLSLSENGELCTWDLTSGQFKQVISFAQYAGVHQLNSDNTLLAVSSENGSMYLFDVKTGEMRTLNQNMGTVNHVQFSADGKWLLVTYANGTVLCWDTKTGTAQKIVGSKNLTIKRGFFINDGLQVFVEETIKNQINVYDIQHNRKHILNAHNADVLQIAFSPDGKLLFSAGSDGLFIVWDVQTQRVIKRFKAMIDKFLVRPDGTIIASDVKYMYLIDVHKGTQQILATHASSEISSVTNMVGTTDGILLAVHKGNDVEFQNKIALWDMNTHMVKQIIQAPMNTVVDYFFIPKTALLAIIGLTDFVLWDVYANQVVLTFSLPGGVFCTAFSNDGSIIEVSGIGLENIGRTDIVELNQTLAQAINMLSFEQLMIIARAEYAKRMGTPLDLSGMPRLRAIFNTIDEAYRDILIKCFDIKI